MSRTLAQDGVKCDQAIAGQHRRSPFIRQSSWEDLSAHAPPRIAALVKRRCESALALLVPVCANRSAISSAPRAGDKVVFGGEDVDALQAWGAVGPAWPASILKGAAELGLVEIFGLANR